MNEADELYQELSEMKKLYQLYQAALQERNGWRILFTSAMVCVVLCAVIMGRWQRATAGSKELPLQIFGCTATMRDKRVLEGEKENIAKGVWKKEDLETLDEIVQDSDMGLHACTAVDPNIGKRFLVVTSSTGYQGHTAVSVLEEKQ